MKKFTLIKSVKAVLPNFKDPVDTDILIHKKSGLIEKIAPDFSISENDTEIIERYKGLLVMPGFIDPHVHFRFPGKEEAEDWFTGSLAALSGGVTTVLDMPNNNPAITNEEALIIKLDHIKENSLINYGLFGGLTATNLDFLLSNPDIKAIKVYMASTTGDLLLNNIRRLDFTDTRKVFCFHAEDDLIIKTNELDSGKITDPWQHSRIRSEEAALKATMEIIEMYKKTGGNFHVAHVTTGTEIIELEKSGVSFECAPHHLFCSTDDYNRGGFLWKCNPPLRESSTRDTMLEALYKEKVQMIATDHAPHPLADKQTIDKIPASGIPSLEVGSHFILSEMAAGKISVSCAAKILSSNAAIRFNIAKRGFIKEGFFADLAIVDTSKNWTFQPDNIFSKCGWSPFLHFNFKAKVAATFVNGYEYAIDSTTVGLNKIKLQGKGFKKEHITHQV